VKAKEETLAENKYFRCTLTEEKVALPYFFATCGPKVAEEAVFIITALSIIVSTT
jgi:hypothetical protein